jgi:beta-glucanase (GH16 family)
VSSWKIYCTIFSSFARLTGAPDSATKGRSVGVSSVTSSNFHTYTVSGASTLIYRGHGSPRKIDWQPETLTWLIDGSVVRTLYKNQTLSSNGTL